MNPTLALCVLGKNSTELRQFMVLSGDVVHEECAEVFLIQNEGGRFEGQAKIGNRFRDACQSTVFGLVHADTFFAKNALQTFCGFAATNNIVTGLVGINLNMEQVWSAQKAVERSKLCGQPARHTGEISTLDGCSIFFAKNSKIRFDETFDNFHCVIEDAVLTATHTHGMMAAVPEAEADHLSLGNDIHSQWMNNYRKYRYMLAQKWGHVPFHTTA
jgi:hypothetical protein